MRQLPLWARSVHLSGQEQSRIDLGLLVELSILHIRISVEAPIQRVLSPEIDMQDTPFLVGQIEKCPLRTMDGRTPAGGAIVDVVPPVEEPSLESVTYAGVQSEVTLTKLLILRSQHRFARPLARPEKGFGLESLEIQSSGKVRRELIFHMFSKMHIG